MSKVGYRNAKRRNKGMKYSMGGSILESRPVWRTGRRYLEEEGMKAGRDYEEGKRDGGMEEGRRDVQ
jgi:hypothetical protein